MTTQAHLYKPGDLLQVPAVQETAFSRFIRTASEDEKRAVYARVMRRVDEVQADVLLRVEHPKLDPE